MMPAPLPTARGSGAFAARDPRAASDLLARGREHERAGCIAEACAQYEAAISLAEHRGEKPLMSEALRALAVLRHQSDEHQAARELCDRSLAVATEVGSVELASAALNTLGVMLLKEGALVDAESAFVRALAPEGVSRALRARAERNLGIVANIKGDLAEARRRYSASLVESEAVGDEHGCAHALHNLAMVSADQHELTDADQYFTKTFEIAERTGDVRLRALCLLNHADVHIARQRFEEARKNAEDSLVMFDQIGARDHKASAYRVIGVVYRETGKLALAESRLRSAIALAQTARSVLVEAEATQELAVTFQAMGRNQEALTSLNASHLLFARLDARIELVNVGGRLEVLEGTYLALVKEWGQSIESSDSYTFGHCSRVAENAVAVAEALGLDALQVTTIRLGAYLHDLGKVKVPHEILNKPDRLTAEEFEVIKQHPVWGMELLDGVEFPWDLKPIIRWHHEKVDGTGYPDQLKGDEVPVAAQIVGIVDVYDALTTSRSYRAAMTHEMAMAQIDKMRSAWSTAVYEAFSRALARFESHSLAA